MFTIEEPLSMCTSVCHGESVCLLTVVLGATSCGWNLGGMLNSIMSASEHQNCA